MTTAFLSSLPLPLSPPQPPTRIHHRSPRLLPTSRPTPRAVAAPSSQAPTSSPPSPPTPALANISLPSYPPSLPSTESLPSHYSLAAIITYWEARPLASASRLAQVTATLGPWGVRTLLAAAAHRLQSDDVAANRAAALRDNLVKLGPCFVKLGQNLSVRPDVIGPVWMKEMRLLTDSVPSFDSSIAMAVIEKELGMKIVDIFSDITTEPVAAASLGQVHRGTLKDGRDVAVKVQRPGMRESVSLDIFCLWQLAKAAEWAHEIREGYAANFVGLLDVWARGTYDELNYVVEKENSRFFKDQFKLRGLDVAVPEVYDQFSARKVLCMEWVSGVPLVDCPEDEINSLIQTGVEAFLLQMLSIGAMHGDPHTANVFKLDDGRLCLIDFGLVARIEKREMDAMVRAIVDLANRNYAGCVRDFIDLGFLGEDCNRDQVEAVLAPILDQALKGGGAKSINFAKLSDDLAGVTFDFPFTVPPAFALLLRALSVLEGIALTGDDEFKLVMASLPFVSRLILTDRSPALREALVETLYKDGVFSPVRLRVLLDSSQGIVNDGSAFVDFDTPAESSSGITADAVDLLFSDDGTVIREILCDELATTLDLLARDTYTRSTSAVSSVLQTFVPAPFRDSLVPTGMMPGSNAAVGKPAPMLSLPWLVTPGKLSFALPPINAAEREQLKGMREVVNWITDAGTDNRTLLDLLPAVLPRCGIVGRLVVGRLAETYASRLFDDLLRGGGESVGGRRRVKGRLSLLPVAPSNRNEPRR